MVRPNKILNAVINSFEQDDRLPDRVNYLDHEPSISTESVKLPVVEVSPTTEARVTEENSDFAGYITDSNGNRVGRIYQSLYTLEFIVAVWTVEESKYDVRELGQSVRDILYEHDTKSVGESLEYDDGTPMDEVWQFRVRDGTHDNDLNTSAPLRRWQQTVSVAASEEYRVSGEETIQSYTL